MQALIYRHEVYPEWIVIKNVRNLVVKVSIDAQGLRECHLTWKVFGTDFAVPTVLQTPIGKALDLILVEMRKCGKYTEEEIKASCPKWALVSRHGEHVMTRCKDETLASKVCYEEIRPNTPHDPEQPPAQRRRIN